MHLQGNQCLDIRNNLACTQLNIISNNNILLHESLIESGLPDTHMIRKNSTNLYQMSDFGKKGKSPFVDEDFVARAGIEPATHGFSVHCSTD